MRSISVKLHPPLYPYPRIVPMFPPVIRKIQSNSTGIKISEALTTSGKDCEELPAPGLDVDHVQHPLLPPPPLHAEAHIPQLEMRILEQPGLPRPTAILEGLQHVGHGAVGGFGEVLVIQDRGIMPRNIIIKYNLSSKHVVAMLYVITLIF